MKHRLHLNHLEDMTQFSIFKCPLPHKTNSTEKFSFWHQSCRVCGELLERQGQQPGVTVVSYLPNCLAWELPEVHSIPLPDVKPKRKHSNSVVLTHSPSMGQIASSSGPQALYLPAPPCHQSSVMTGRCHTTQQGQATSREGMYTYRVKCRCSLHFPKHRQMCPYCMHRSCQNFIHLKDLLCSHAGEKKSMEPLGRSTAGTGLPE